MFHLIKILLPKLTGWSLFMLPVTVISGAIGCLFLNNYRFIIEYKITLV